MENWRHFKVIGIDWKVWRQLGWDCKITGGGF